MTVDNNSKDTVSVNNISYIVAVCLLMEETRVPVENYQPATRHTSSNKTLHRPLYRTLHILCIG